MLLLNQKIHLQEGETISIPTSVFSCVNDARRKDLIILMLFIKNNDDEFDNRLIEEAAQYGCSLDDVGEALTFWKSKGILYEEGEDKRETIGYKLKLMLNREPKPYEIDKLETSMKIYNISLLLLIKIMDMGVKEGKVSVDWIIGIMRYCAQSEDPIEQCNVYERYYSLTKALIKGLGLKRQLTKKEKDIILEWAEKEVPLDFIYEAYEKSKTYAGNFSFFYMNGIIKKIDLKNAALPDNRGY